MSDYARVDEPSHTSKFQAIPPAVAEFLEETGHDGPKFRLGYYSTVYSTVPVHLFLY